MAIEAAFESLRDRLWSLKEAVDELQLNVSGGYEPESRSGRRGNGESQSKQAPPPVVGLADKVSELEGTVDQAHYVATKALRHIRHPRNLTEAQVALTIVQRCLNGLLRTFFDEVAAYDALQTLLSMGRREGGKWPGWVALVKTVIEACRAPLHQALQALAECWQELAEKLTSNSVSVTATNIGQQITTREPLGEVVDGVT